MPTFSQFIAAISTLFVFGLLYNALVAEMERRNIEGYTWFQVTFGSFATIVASSFLIGWDKAITVFLCFVASGIPMIAGAILRHQKKYQHLIKKIKGPGFRREQ
jgi:hypothetical protein